MQHFGTWLKREESHYSSSGWFATATSWPNWQPHRFLSNITSVLQKLSLLLTQLLDTDASCLPPRAASANRSPPPTTTRGEKGGGKIYSYAVLSVTDLVTPNESRVIETT